MVIAFLVKERERAQVQHISFGERCGKSSLAVVVGALWSAFGTQIAFDYNGVLFFAGAAVIARVKSRPP